MSTPIEKMEAELMEILRDYQDLTDEEMEQVVKKTANTVKNAIKQEAPRDTERYKDSWVTKKTTSKRHKTAVTIHSRDRYQLTHLLENGHELKDRNGNKIGDGYVSEKPHIAPATENAEKELMYQLRKLYEKKAKL